MVKHISTLSIASFIIIGLWIEMPVTAEVQTTNSYSFENDMEGWNPTGVSLDAPGGVGSIPWSITRSQDIAADGKTSIKLFIDNQNDGGKIYIEKSFPVEPHQLYHARVEYAFGALDYGSANLFTIVAGVLKSQPKTGDDLPPAMKDETANGSEKDIGYQWIHKDYEFTVRSEEEALWVVIGIWGTYEARRTYYLDDVRVTLTKKAETSQFYSFEDDLQGWTSNASDLDLGSGSIERVQQYALGGEDGKYSIKFDLDRLNGNGKVWIERPFLVERGRKYKVSLDYAFHSTDCGDTPRFRIISGVFRRPPETGEDLLDAVQEKTTSTGCTWGWLHKGYQFTIKAKKTDALVVVIGIWGTEKAHRTYNVDSICVTITPK